MSGLLRVENLQTFYFTKGGRVKAVDNVNLQLEKGETLGIVGESACGKSTLCLSILRMVPYPGRIVGGHIFLEGQDLVTMSEKQLQEIRWKKISTVFQGSMNALNPMMKIGDQICEPLIIHERVDKSEAWKRAIHLLKLVGMDESKAKCYPHELSGGMKQRALIVMALCLNPELVIADEPTTALDVIVQALVLKYMKELQQSLNLSLIIITHDLSIATEICEKCAVMYAGQIIENGNIKNIFRSPLHPYTRSLIECVPSIAASKPLTFIPGRPPSLLEPSPGCRFRFRCRDAKEICSKQDPKIVDVGKDHQVMCHLVG